MANQEEFVLSISHSIYRPRNVSFEQKIMKNVNVRQPFSEIPSALIWEILGRVSIKTCLTCKLVCREWYRIIVDPPFSSFRRHCLPSSFTMLFQDRGNIARASFWSCLVEFQKALDVDRSGDCNVGVDDIVVFSPRKNTCSRTWHVMAHCYEVVCFITPKKKFTVCNLLTGQCVDLQDIYGYSFPYDHLSRCALGYCPESGEYKVLIVILDVLKDTQTVKIQTVGSHEWRSVPNPPFIYAARNPRMDDQFLNGSIHWLDRNVIVSFHFGKEKLSQIPLPDDISCGSYKKIERNLGVFESCLCLTCFSKKWRVPPEIDVWIMKEYGAKESWVRQFVIIMVHHSIVWPLMDIGKGKILVKRDNELHLYDTQTHVSKRVELKLDVLCRQGYGFRC